MAASSKAVSLKRNRTRRYGRSGVRGFADGAISSAGSKCVGALGHVSPRHVDRKIVLYLYIICSIIYVLQQKGLITNGKDSVDKHTDGHRNEERD